MTQQYLHTFKAPTLEEAYRRMRKELGQDAIVLRAAEIKEGGIFGLLARRVFTVTAALPPRAARANVSTRTPSAVERRYAGAAAKPAHTAAAPIGSEETVKETVAYFQKVVEEAQRRIRTGESTPDSAVPPKAGDAAAASSQQTSRNLQDDLAELRAMMNVLVAEKPGAGLPVELAPHYRALVDAGCERTVAAGVVSAAVQGLDPALLRDARLVRERVRLQLRRGIAVREGLSLAPGRCVVAAVAGPTGVGKTTNLAKLAAHFSVRERASVALITADTYRVAAPEQLRVYANIIGLPMDVVNTPAEMARSVAKYRNRDLILIDTAGSSQFNARQISELEELLAAAAPDEVMLMLAANTQPEELRSSAQAFQGVRPGSIFFTKLDETKRYGVMYSALAGLKLPLCYVSVGQNVPDDFMVAHPGKLADLVLEGRDNHGRSSSKSA